MQVGKLSDDELLSSLQATCLATRRAVARIVLFLGEVEERQLHLKASYPTMYEFCLRGLNMTESEAFRRIAAARIVRRFPKLLEWVELGRIHLTGLVLLRNHLTPENHEDLVRAVAGKSKRQVEEFIANEFPQPDAPSRIRKLPAPPTVDVKAHTRGKAGAAGQPPSARVAPLAPARFKIQFTATAEFRDKLHRITELMRHQNSRGDIVVIFERALDLLLSDLEKQRLGKSSQPRKGPRTAKAGYVTRAVRRAVFARDGEQCTYVDATGHRCQARGFLELDHRQSRALGGTDDIDNLRVRCRGHNDLHNKQTFGKAHVARQIERRQRRGS